MIRAVLFLLVGVVAAGCGKSSKTQRQEVLAIQQMSDLVTVEYVVTKIIKANDNKTWYKVGDRKILMSCRASIKAGIDLAGLTDKDIAIDGKDISIALPPAKLISLNMPPESIIVEYEEIDAFRSPFKAGERDALAAQAEAQIKSSVEAMGVLQTAQGNAQAFVTDFLKRLGFNNITITTQGATPAKPSQL